MIDTEHKLSIAIGMLKELVDPDTCNYDHHGNCQAHGCSSNPCIMERVKQFLKDNENDKVS